MIIDREPIQAYAHCLHRIKRGVQCEGEKQQPVDGVRERVQFVYADGWGNFGTSSPQDAILANIVERESINIRFADPERDGPCPFCGQLREVTDQVRPEYESLSGVPQDELLRRQRAVSDATVATASAAERQAIALEAIAAGGTPGEIAQLREIVARQSEQLERLLAAGGNGHDAEPEQRPSDVAPRPARKTRT